MLSPPGVAWAGCWRAWSARSGLWGQGWVSLMYGKSPTRAVLFLLGLQLTGKSSRAFLSISSTAYPIKLAHCPRSCKSLLLEPEPQLHFALVLTLMKLKWGGCFGGTAFGKTGLGVFWLPVIGAQRGFSNLRLHSIFLVAALHLPLQAEPGSWISV